MQNRVIFNPQKSAIKPKPIDDPSSAYETLYPGRSLRKDMEGRDTVGEFFDRERRYRESVERIRKKQPRTQQVPVSDVQRELYPDPPEKFRIDVPESRLDIADNDLDPDVPGINKERASRMGCEPMDSSEEPRPYPCEKDLCYTDPTRLRERPVLKKKRPDNP